MISVFKFKNQQLRVFGTDEKPMFLAKEVGEVLGLSNIKENLRNLKPTWRDVVSLTDSIGRLQNQVVISEPAVYKLAFSSRKEEAQVFVNWVCEEVLPSIRRTGKYQLEQKLEARNGQIELLEEQVEDLNEQVDQLETKIEELQHLSATRHDKITISERLAYLGYIDERVIASIMNEHRGEHNIEMYHPDRKKFIKNISTISRRMSRAKKDRDGTYPLISRSQRNNMYFMNDYINFGDTIIHAYFLEKPFENWNIDVDFEFPQ